MAEQQNVNDPDAGKGAVEGDGRGHSEEEKNGNTSLSGQNPHRVNSQLVKANDSDFPEPGNSPEHSGERAETSTETGHSPERDEVNQDPGHRQKENQADKKDDPLAA